MPDMHRIGNRFQKKQATLEEVVRVYQAVLKVWFLWTKQGEKSHISPA